MITIARLHSWLILAPFRTDPGRAPLGDDMANRLRGRAMRSPWALI
jgi:hypothetical protein